MKNNQDSNRNRRHNDPMESYGRNKRSTGNKTQKDGADRNRNPRDREGREEEDLDRW